MHQSKAKCRPTSDFVPWEARHPVVRGEAKEDAGKLDEVCVGGEELETVAASRRFGSTVECDADADLDVDARRQVARSTFSQLHPLWKSTTLSARVKLKIFRASVGVTARCGPEAWALDEETLKELRGRRSSRLGELGDDDLQALVLAQAQDVAEALRRLGADGRGDVGRAVGARLSRRRRRDASSFDVTGVAASSTQRHQLLELQDESLRNVTRSRDAWTAPTQWTRRRRLRRVARGDAGDRRDD